MTDRLQKIMDKIRKEKKETPFTTSIRIEKEIYDEVVKYLNKNNVAFSDFINEYLKETLEKIKNIEEEEMEENNS